MRTYRFEMRLPPELAEQIDAARGEVQRTTWIKGAIKMRLADPQGAVPARAATAAPTASKPSSEQAEPPARSQGSSSPPPSRKAASAAEGNHQEHTFKRRPSPRMTGGRRKR